jgi:hypothetical protein
MYELEDFRLARGSLSGMISRPPTNTSSSSSGSIGIAASSDFVLVALAAKSGAGGKGLRGLPPYAEEGVPGRGLPFKSAGSYEATDGVGRVQSVDVREGVEGRTGDERSGDRSLGTLAVGRGNVGVCPRLEPGLEWVVIVEAAGRRYLSGEVRGAL